MSSPTANDLSDVAEEGWPSHAAEILCPPVPPLLPLGLIPGQIPKCAFCFEYDAAPCPVASPLPACLAFSAVTLHRQVAHGPGQQVCMALHPES